MSDNTFKDPIIIIGAGMAGYTLARELRKLNADTPITLIARDGADSYAKPTLSNALAQGKLADNIANASAEQMAENLAISVMKFCQVNHIDVEKKTITVEPINLATQNSNATQILSYAKLVLATGANPRLLPNVNVDNERIFAVNHLDDYKKFQQKIHALLTQANAETGYGKVNVAIIGAGLIGCEFANDLASKVNSADNANALNITVFDNAKLPLANQLPAVAGEALQTALQDVGVTFELGVTIDSIQPSGNLNNVNDGKSGVEIVVKNANADLIHHQADVVLIAIGLVANTQLAENARLKIAQLSDSVSTDTHLPRTAQQGILVDQFLQTSVKDVYAIGDCANVMGSFMPYVMPLMNQAKALAKTLSDQLTDPTLPPTKVNYPAMPVAIKTPALPLVVLPVSARYSADDIDWQQQMTDDGMVLSAFAKGDSEKLLGFVLVGKEAGKQRMALAKQVADWL
ncbi:MULTISPECIES: FAD-dependent oxidoreductase [unclassified Moraxella]|uniref:FAD-dependent oxidoreductase n=1 Tax=unclassified Moraxella TaxID=2685852 RepID=UPI003AF72A33